ncbi:alginate lyase family protein [Acaryochloris sp. IP29b_bin.137]|uniref:alginate lyase family protein n=1 Tax=Acaryochloris sp. IP29b_bin.137 TaxID=2969217 RepID=UPI00260FD8C4|nr:alginate lyase family protein [Acaryochloris sp. IP29b_bin.137]
MLANIGLADDSIPKSHRFSEGRDVLDCETILHYYREAQSIPWLRMSRIEPSCKTIELGERVLQNTLSFQECEGQVPLRDDGHLDWMYQGPNSDREWTWFLNRHYHLRDLFVAYKLTGNPVYVRYLNDQIVDWILWHPSTDNISLWAQWRGLEVVFRVIHWAEIFYGLQQVEEFTDAARILMLSSIQDHAYYLRHLNSWGANWLIKEMCGLATIALCWPEFTHAQQWLTFALDRLLQNLPSQIYPDGAHKELTSHYHTAVLLDLQHLGDLLEEAGLPTPHRLHQFLVKMWNYLAYSMRPEGYGVLNNDSDRNDNRDLVLQAAAQYQRLDWTFIASNGVQGVSPRGHPSKMFPWAGQMVMRSGWEKTAHWAWFDIGPMGIYYHIHNDKLHLSVAAYGRDLLVDGGRYSYIRSKFWHYFRGSASHNVILIDGQGQKNSDRESLQPVSSWAIEPQFDFSRGAFEHGFTGVSGTVKHRRAVVYLRGQYWVVVDQVMTHGPCQITPLWHFHPDCTVALQGESAVSTDLEVGNLRIIPCASFAWSVDLVRGQEEPVQGWWSGTYNQKLPNTAAVYTAQISRPTTFAWILLPALGPVSYPTVQLLSISEESVSLGIDRPGHSRDIVAVRLGGTAPVDLGNTLVLDGDCAISQRYQRPLVAHGTVTDATGTILAQHPHPTSE